MAPRYDFDTAREAFIEVALRHDDYAPDVTREDGEEMIKAICKTSNFCTDANIEVCSETRSHCPLLCHFSLTIPDCCRTAKYSSWTKSLYYQAALENSRTS